MTEEQFQKAANIRREMGILKMYPDILGKGDPGFSMDILVEFIDTEKYNQLKAEKIERLEKELAAI